MNNSHEKRAELTALPIRILTLRRSARSPTLPFLRIGDGLHDGLGIPGQQFDR